MQLKDLHILTSSTDAIIVPYADLSSLWFKSFFDNVIKKGLTLDWNNPAPGLPELDLAVAVIIILILIVVFSIPFIVRFYFKTQMQKDES